jgi:hypothetical protein
LDYMLMYNKEDVWLLEDIFIRIMPYIKPYVNIALYMDAKEPSCAYCGSTNIIETGKFYYTSVGKYPVFRCGDCRGLTRSRKSDLTKPQRDNLLTPIAR